jgi:hypothetical protein
MPPRSFGSRQLLREAQFEALARSRTGDPAWRTTRDACSAQVRVAVVFSQVVLVVLGAACRLRARTEPSDHGVGAGVVDCGCGVCGLGERGSSCLVEAVDDRVVGLGEQVAVDVGGDLYGAVAEPAAALGQVGAHGDP